MSLPNDISAQIAKVLASGNKVEAARLAGMVAQAIGRGEASGFASDLADLQRLAGTEAGGFGKFAKAAVPIDFPADLKARADVVIRALERAKTPIEKAAAERDGVALLSEIEARKAIASVHNAPARIDSPSQLTGFFK